MSLQVSQLTKDYPTRGGPLSILCGIDLEMEPGQSLAILGPSGSGKSTFLQVLGTLDKPTSGSVKLGTVNPFMLPEAQLASFRNQNVGFIFQDHHLLPQCTVLENVLVPTIAKRQDGAIVAAWARKLLDRVDLADRLDHRPAELSGGERQRVAVARALIHHPKLVLADEPTGNLDRATARLVAQLLVDLHREESNVLLVVTHSLELAQLFAERREMVDGMLQAVGAGQ